MVISTILRTDKGEWRSWKITDARLCVGRGLLPHRSKGELWEYRVFRLSKGVVAEL